MHDMSEPDNSRSNRRTGQDLACIEMGGQVSRHHNLLPSFLGRRSFAPLIEHMIESDHGGEIPAFLLRSSHSGLKNFEARRCSSSTQADIFRHTRQKKAHFCDRHHSASPRAVPASTTGPHGAAPPPTVPV